MCSGLFCVKCTCKYILYLSLPVFFSMFLVTRGHTDLRFRMREGRVCHLNFCQVDNVLPTGILRADDQMAVTTQAVYCDETLCLWTFRFAFLCLSPASLCSTTPSIYHCPCTTSRTGYPHQLSWSGSVTMQVRDAHVAGTCRWQCLLSASIDCVRACMRVCVRACTRVWVCMTKAMQLVCERYREAEQGAVVATSSYCCQKSWVQ